MRRIYKILFGTSIVLSLIAIISIFAYGMNFGADFNGGSVIELRFTYERPPISGIVELLKTLSTKEITEAAVTPVGDYGVIIRMSELQEQEHQQFLSLIENKYPVAGLVELKFDSIGPVIGSELKHKSITAILLVLTAVCIYIALVFRKLVGVLSPWVMGVAAIVALMHDLLIPMGIFAWLGNFKGVEISAVFVAAVLTILGYSISDTVVIFDRVRENVIRVGSKLPFAEVVHKSIMETLVRSLNTTFTTLLALISIYLFGGESVRYFALALIIGISLGAYSSIAIASPLLVWWSKGRKAGA